MESLTINELLTTLRERGVQIWLDGPDLRYRSPSGALPPDLLAQLDQQKKAVIENLQNARGSTTGQLLLCPRPQSSKLPLSFAQERLWFLDQLEPGSAVYNIPLGLRLKGPLNVNALRNTLGEILRRHEALRTHFEMVNGEPCQIIETTVPLAMPLVDLSGISGPERDAEAIRLCVEEAQHPFQLAKDAMLRTKLFRLGTDEHILLLIMHHIASDGWSIAILIGELKVLYLAFCAGRPSPLPELPLQYADFVLWQRDWFRGPVLEQQLDYWKRQLAGAPMVLEFPADYSRPASQSYRGAVLSYKLPPTLLPALNELSRRVGASLFMTLMAAFQALLYRYTGQEDILVGTAIAGRNRSEVENLIGFFVNTLVLRADLSGDPTFRTLLDRTREVALNAYAHQELPFEKLVEVLQPERDLSRSPLFQASFVLLNQPTESLKLEELELTPLPLHNDTAKFDLLLYALENGRTLELTFEYNTDLFETQTIRRLAGHYENLLAGLIANPDQPLSTLPLLNPAERRQILEEWNRTEVSYPKNRCLHELVEDQVKHSPDALAVVFENQQLTYRQLNERANQLAHHLRKLGVGPDILVGICMERSVEMVVGLLGILKAGGAYVPLDPEYPKDRLTFMMEDANASLLLTQARLLDLIPSRKAKSIFLDAEWATIARESPMAPVNVARADHLAYMIYTSGSTGKPKGAMNTHVGIVNRLLWMQDAYQLTPSDRVLQKTPFSFDVSVWEFFWPLITGATLVVALPGGHMDGAYLAELIAREKITTLHFVPSMLSAFLEQERLASSCRSLRRVICSGEALSCELQQRYFSLLSAGLHNLYGPTEAAVDVTHWSCERDSRLHTVPIGRPIANTQLYILDRNMQPVPVGVPGELHIGGIGLARGYHNRPELTAEKFIPNPFVPEARLYKTGDLCRYLPDRNVEYLGRLDHQVKIRGFRIELGEIEAQLAAHPAIKEAVVVAREDTVGDKRLTAYLTAKNGKLPKVLELSALLQTKLPDYMVPSAFVILKQFPRTPNGKLDRKALPKPDAEKIEIGQNYVAPANYLEQVLCNLWREVLKVKRVGIKDNFFDLGGHSLLAVRLINETNKTLKTNLNVPQFFNNPTVEQLARLLNQGKRAEPVPQLIALQPGQSDGAIYFLEAGMGLCRLAELLDTGPASFATLAPLPPGTSQAAQRRHLHKLPHLEELAATHASLIRKHNYPGRCILVGHSFGGILAFEVAHQLQREGHTVDMIFLLDAWAVFPPWWQRARVLSFDRFIKSLSFRAGRLWKKAKTGMDSSAKKIISDSEQQSISEDVNLPFGEAPWEILSMLYQKARKDYRLRPLNTRALLFRAQDNGTTPFYAFDDNMGWGKLFEGGLEVVDCPGDHFTLLKAPHIQFLVQKFEATSSPLNHIPKAK